MVLSDDIDCVIKAVNDDLKIVLPLPRFSLHYHPPPHPFALT